LYFASEELKQPQQSRTPLRASVDVPLSFVPAPDQSLRFDGVEAMDVWDDFVRKVWFFVF
jgi:hypothetical protein